MSRTEPDRKRLILPKRPLLLAAVLFIAACSTPSTDVSDELDQIRTEISSIRDSITTTTSIPDAASSSSTSTSTTPPAITTSPDTSPATVPTTTIPPAPPDTDGPEFPSEIEALEHGQEVWVVILAASEGFGDPALQTAVLNAEDAGYFTGPTDCDAGAVEALGLPDGEFYYTVSVYLGSEANAIAARDAFAARGIGGTVAEVQAYCLD